MRILSSILFTIAALVGSCAILIYVYLTNLACGYAPGAASCHGGPRDFAADDRFWLVGLPSAIVSMLLVLALWARRKSNLRKRK